jgi:hypothetical protein
VAPPRVKRPSALGPSSTLGSPNIVAAMGSRRAAGPVEIWAARAWNILNEGRPFSVVYPALVLLCAAPLGLAPDGPLLLAPAGAVGLAVVQLRSDPRSGNALEQLPKRLVALGAGTLLAEEASMGSVVRTAAVALLVAAAACTPRTTSRALARARQKPRVEHWPGGELGCMRTDSHRVRWPIEAVPLGTPIFIRSRAGGARISRAGGAQIS